LAVSFVGVGGSVVADSIAGAGGLHAQEVPRLDSPDALVRAAARAWAAGDADGLTVLLAPGGVALELPGSSNPAVRPGQARAALERLFRLFDTKEVRVEEVSALGGIPPRGMARLVWRTASAGTPRSHPVFLALEEGGEGWSITEVRLLPGRLPPTSTTSMRRP
jgi:hypothetical protein